MSPGATKVDLEGPKTPPKGPEDGPRVPIWSPKWAKGPPQSAKWTPMVPLGRLWAPFGLPWGGFGGLRVTFGDPFDTSGRHCGEGADMRQTLACVCQNDIREATLGQTSAQSRHAGTKRGPQTCTQANQELQKRQQRSQEGPERPARPPRPPNREKGDICGSAGAAG